MTKRVDVVLKILWTSGQSRAAPIEIIKEKQMAEKKKNAKLASDNKNKPVSSDDDLVTTLHVWHEGMKLKKRFEKVKRVSFR